MSYFKMDHAEWLENVLQPRLKRPLTAFERRVANIIGMTGGGIYNCDINWDKADFRDGKYPFVRVVWGSHRMATWDFNGLTLLVFLCHEARIRGDIRPCAPNRFELHFHPRTADGGFSERHPNLDEAVSAFRQSLAIPALIAYPAPPRGETVEDAA